MIAHFIISVQYNTWHFVVFYDFKSKFNSLINYPSYFTNQGFHRFLYILRSFLCSSLIDRIRFLGIKLIFASSSRA